MFKDEFKQRYTTIPFAIYRAYTGRSELTISHQHREMELIAVKEGSADFYIDARRYSLEAGDILIIPPYAIHRGNKRGDKEISYNCICLNLDLLCDSELKSGLENRTLSSKAVIHAQEPFSEKIQECIEAGCTACEKKYKGWELDAVGNVSLVFGILKKEGYFFSDVQDKSKNDFAGKVMDYIINNYTSAITSGWVASALFMDNSYFCRVFKKTFGCCFSDYVLAYRLERAKIYLENTKLTVTEISYLVGFNSCSYFGKTFKQRFGFPPNQYRKNK